MTVALPLPLSFSDRDEWLEWRRAGIGGSDAAAVCGLDPWRKPRDIWLDKKGLAEPFTGNIATQAGTFLEPFLRTLFTQETGLEPHGYQDCREHPERPWMRATLDAWVGSDAILETKVTTTASRWREGPPEHVLAQVTHNMIVAGVALAYVAVLMPVGSWGFAVHQVELSETLAGLLAMAEERFWAKVQLDEWGDEDAV